MRLFALACLALLLAAPAAAQHYTDLDNCAYDRGLNSVNGLRVYFDESVHTGCGGILMDPGYFAVAGLQQVDVYLVLTHPTATSLQLWQCDFEMVGQGLVQESFFFGTPIADLGSGATHVVVFNTPLPLGATHVPLARFRLLLAADAPQPGQTFNLVEFYLKPATGEVQPAPGYLDGDDVFVPCASFTSPYHGWDAPCMLLNDDMGVTGGEAESWGGLKALYR